MRSHRWIWQATDMTHARAARTARDLAWVEQFGRDRFVAVRQNAAGQTRAVGPMRHYQARYVVYIWRRWIARELMKAAA